MLVIAALSITGLLGNSIAPVWAGVPPAGSRPGDPVKGLRMRLELPPSQRRLHVGERMEARLILENVDSRPLIVLQDWAFDVHKGWSTWDPFHILLFLFDADGWPLRPPPLHASFNTARYDRGRDAFIQLDPGSRLEKLFPLSLSSWKPGLYGLEVSLQMNAEVYESRLDAEELPKAWTGRVASNRVMIELVARE